VWVVKGECYSAAQLEKILKKLKSYF